MLYKVYVQAEKSRTELFNFNSVFNLHLSVCSPTLFSYQYPPVSVVQKACCAAHCPAVVEHGAV